MPESIGLTRRDLLIAAGVLAIPGLTVADRQAKPARFALPGPYRGRVVEVYHPDSVRDNVIQPKAVTEMMARGMCELTGATGEAAAWKRLFAPGDRVGVKVCPVGRPHSISQKETVLEVIRGLNLAGVHNENILVFNRYKDEFLECGIVQTLPKGVQSTWASDQFDGHQTDLTGYDPETFAEFDRVVPDLDPMVAVNRRSHLCNIVSKQVDKVVNICALKDHASAGLTMALKNLSHGMANNVCRTHTSSDNNWCDIFIPGVVSMKKLREKVVLHIGDGLIGTYDGGPGIWNAHFATWEYRSLFFATDPVAMDRIGWSILDAQRATKGLPPLAQTGIKATNPGNEQFDRRQPEHVLLAAKAGLGEADLSKITHRKITLRI